ncbi:hypothetical protein [Gottfriedia acidiceleris]|uniref:hypothetical protein n=1 Tax=Gottfriedia acidiceleris TaxID=371036 RepID=UPI00142FD81E|nr:hypothetical protein [Gottfriedia acidiceleris]
MINQFFKIGRINGKYKVTYDGLEGCKIIQNDTMVYYLMKLESKKLKASALSQC